MKQTNLTRSHSEAVTRGLVAATAARSFSWVEEMANDSGVDITEGAVVVVLLDGTIQLADTVNEPRPTGVALDDIEDGDSGQVCFGGPVDLVQVVASVTAGDYGQTSTTPGEAQVASGPAVAFCMFTDSGTTPSAFLWGGRGGGGFGAGITAGDISVVDIANYFTATNVEDVLQELASKDIGYQAHGTMGATETFSALVGWHSGTFDADCTFTFTGATSGLVASMVLELLEDGTGGWQPSWPGSVVWPGGVTPTHDDTAGTTTIYLFESRDGGTTWYGFQAGGGGTSITFGTPAIVLGTAAAAGSIDEVIRRDATIVAFDATVPVTQAFGDSPATGSAAVTARRDHVHGMPADPTTGFVPSGSHAHVVGETHLSDGSTTTYTLDENFEPGSVEAFNTTTLAYLVVTETAPDQATVSAAGSSGDKITFSYAATIA